MPASRNLSTQSILFYEDEKYREVLQKKVDTIESYGSDLIVLITTTDEKIKQMIAGRGRTSEQTEIAYLRAVKIQNILIRLAQDRKDVLVVDRTGLRFENEKDLRVIDALIKKRLGR